MKQLRTCFFCLAFRLVNSLEKVVAFLSVVCRVFMVFAWYYVSVDL